MFFSKNANRSEMGIKQIKMKKKKNLKQIEKSIFCFALMLLLQGCSETTEGYGFIVALTAVTIFIIFKVSNDIRMRSVKGIILILSGLILLTCTTLFIISWNKDIKEERLVMESPLIRSCLQPERSFIKTKTASPKTGFVTPVKVEKPFIIIKKSRNNNEWGILHYSEKKRINTKLIEELKTIVLVKDESKPRDEYSYGRGGGVKVRVHDAEITYIDLINRKYEKEIYLISIPESTDGSRDHFAGSKEIIDAVISKPDYADGFHRISK